jgi:hypothetical protein
MLSDCATWSGPQPTARFSEYIVGAEQRAAGEGSWARFAKLAARLRETAPVSEDLTVHARWLMRVRRFSFDPWATALIPNGGIGGTEIKRTDDLPGQPASDSVGHAPPNV